MKIDVLTIFPEFFTEVFDFGIIRRAKFAEIVEINIHDLRYFTTDKHRMTDDRPFGGGDGMVLKCEPIFNAIEKLSELASAKIIRDENASRFAFAAGQSFQASRCEGIC